VEGGRLELEGGKVKGWFPRRGGVHLSAIGNAHRPVE